MCCNNFFAKALFPFLFKWSFLLSKWNFLIPLLSTKLVPFCIQKFFIRAFVPVFAVNDRWKCDRCQRRFFKNFTEDFLNVGQKAYLIGDIISSNMNHEIVWYFLDYVIQFLQNLFSCTTWKVHNFYFVVNTKTFLRDTIHDGVSDRHDFFFLLESSVWVSLFFVSN